MLGLAWEQSLQRAFLALPDLVHALNVFYFGREGFIAFRDCFLAATALAVVIHWLYPTAAPRLAGVGLGGHPADPVRDRHRLPDRRCNLEPVAAVPSLHAAYALGVGIGMMRYGCSHVVRLAGLVYPPLVVLTIVVTGNHFLLDAVAGMAVLGAGFVVVRWWHGRGHGDARVCTA